MENNKTYSVKLKDGKIVKGAYDSYKQLRSNIYLRIIAQDMLPKTELK